MLALKGFGFCNIADLSREEKVRGSLERSFGESANVTKRTK
jgi:hypothetical protein